MFTESFYSAPSETIVSMKPPINMYVHRYEKYSILSLVKADLLTGSRKILPPPRDGNSRHFTESSIKQDTLHLKNVGINRKPDSLCSDKKITF